MKNMGKLLGGLLVLSIFLVGCTRQSIPVSSLIPETAFGFIQITNPDQFLNNLDDFSQKLGLDKLTKNKKSRDLLSEYLRTQNLDIAMLDLGQSMAVAFMPSNNPEQPYQMIWYIPVRNLVINAVKVAPFMAEFGEYKTATAGDYLIFYTGEESLSFPPAKPLQLSALAKFQDGTISLYGDMGSILGKYKNEWGILKSSAIKEMQTLDKKQTTSLGPQSLFWGEHFLSSVFSTLEQTTGFGLGILINGQGIRVNAFSDFTPNGTVSELFRAIGPGQRISDQAKLIPANFTYAGAVNGNSKAFQAIYKKSIEAYAQAIKLDQPAQAALQAMIDESYALLGNQASFGLDLTIDPKIHNALAQANLGHLASVFSVDLVGSIDVSDSSAYVNFLEKSIQSTFLRSYLGKVSSLSGLSVGIIGGNQNDGDFSYKTMKLKVGPVAEQNKKTTPASDPSESLISSLANKLEFSYAGKGNKVYLVMGNQAGASLKRLVSQGQVENSAATNESWQAYLRSIPADAQFVGNLSTSKLLEMAKIINPNNQALELKDKERSGIFSYIRFGDHSIEGSSYWDIKEIVPIAKLALKMGGKIFQ